MENWATMERVSTISMRMWSDGEALLNDKVWSQSVSVQPLWNGAKGARG